MIWLKKGGRSKFPAHLFLGVGEKSHPHPFKSPFLGLNLLAAYLPSPLFSNKSWMANFQCSIRSRFEFWATNVWSCLLLKYIVNFDSGIFQTPASMVNLSIL